LFFKSMYPPSQLTKGITMSLFKSILEKLGLRKEKAESVASAAAPKVEAAKPAAPAVVKPAAPVAVKPAATTVAQSGAARAMKAFLGLRDTDHLYSDAAMDPGARMFGIDRAERGFARIRVPR
jgi:hypothetical protein